MQTETEKEDALSILFPETKPIELEPERRRGTEMLNGNWRLVQTALSIVGAGSLVYSGCAVFAPDLLGGDALKGMEIKEASHLRQVQRYCFNRLPFLNDSQTCTLWAGRYVKLVSGVDPQIDLFASETKKANQETLSDKVTPETRQKWESEAEAATVPGKSPAEGR